jgi:hypothetical protein
MGTCLVAGLITRLRWAFVLPRYQVPASHISQTHQSCIASRPNLTFARPSFLAPLLSLCARHFSRRARLSLSRQLVISRIAHAQTRNYSAWFSDGADGQMGDMYWQFASLLFQYDLFSDCIFASMGAGHRYKCCNMAERIPRFAVCGGRPWSALGGEGE